MITSKKYNFSKWTQLLLSAMLLFVFTSCNSEEGREFLGFFMGFLIFLMGTIITGIPALVFSAVGINSKHKAVPPLSIVFTVLYFIFLIIQIGIFSNQGANDIENVILIFPVITIAIIVLCAVFIYMGFKRRSKGFIGKADDHISVLDDIINTEDDKDLI